MDATDKEPALTTFDDGHLHSDRGYFDPVEWLCRRGVPCPHLTFDPDVVPEYRIIRGSTHDGTFLFSDQLIVRVLEPLVSRTSYYTRNLPDWTRLTGTRYTVGLVRVAIVTGLVDLPCGRYPGQRERLTLPVRCFPQYGTPGEGKVSMDELDADLMALTQATRPGWGSLGRTQAPSV